MGGSIALVQLTELKHQRMKQCAEFQQRRRLKYRACQKDAPC